MRRYLLVALLTVSGLAAATLRVPVGGDLAAAVVKARAQARPATIELADGTHYLPATLRLGPRDSGLTFAAAPGAHPVISGGRPVTGWQVRDGVWETTLPDVAAGAWRPRQLFVGGQRATVCRTPNEGFFRVAGYDAAQPKRAFNFNAGELDNWPDLGAATLVVLHSWETSVMPITSVDPAKRHVVLGGDCVWDFGYWSSPQRWYVEGVAAAFDAPGEWHLDARTGRLRYRPLPGQSPERTPVVAANLTELVTLTGDQRLGLPVTDVHFQGLTFAHGDWQLPAAGHSDPQAVCTEGGNVSLRGAAGCSFADCRFVHLGSYAVALREGSRDCRIERCEFADVGAGAVRLGETYVAREPELRCEGHVVDNCWVHDYGQVFAGGVGIWLAQAGDCRISHNDIHDGWYTGISLGWDWGRAPTASHGNQILDNHIHHIVKGRLSDAGGIYTLGELDGGRLAGNVIHDLFAFTEPDYSWGIYLDSESHGLTVEDNTVWAVEDGLMLHNGAYNNTVRRNTFAQAADYLIWRSPASIPMPNTFTDNTCLVTQGSLFLPDAKPDVQSTWDRNRYWRNDGRELLFMDDDFATWQARGVDAASRVVDPKLTLPLPIGSAGLYGDAAWVAKPRAVKHPPTVVPTTKITDGPQPVIEDFESTPVGGKPAGLVVSLGKVPGGRVEVSDQQPAVGRHCLRIVDAKALEHTWEPHAFWQPRLRKGTAHLTFHWWVGPGSEPWSEWRSLGQPFKTGPSLRIGADRKLVANGKPLVAVPEQTWLTLTIDCPLGKAADGHYNLKLAIGDAAATDLGQQTCDPAFDSLGWLGFVALADAPGEFRLDDLRLTVD